MKEITIGNRVIFIDVDPSSIGKMLSDIHTHSKKYQVNSNTEMLRKEVRKTAISKLAA